MSEYFEQRSQTEEFNRALNDLIEKLQGKKVIVYGAGQTYFDLQRKYDLKNKLNITGIADKKFEAGEIELFDSLPAIKPANIKEADFDAILLTIEYPPNVLEFLKNELKIEAGKIFCALDDDIFDERESFLYLLKLNFKNNLEKLKQKLAGKSVIFYGACPFFQVIKKYYNLDGFNVIGIADKKFAEKADSELFEGYKTIKPCEITKYNPDFVVVTTKFYVSIIDELYYRTLKGSKIKIRPMVKKSFMTLLKEIWR